MLVSVREVLQLAERCFSAAGFEAGVAQTNARAIWWTEAYRREGLTTLHALLDDLAAVDSSARTLYNRQASIARIDSETHPVVVASTPALDLACSQARSYGIGMVHATTAPDDVSVSTLGHVAYNAVTRGYLPVVLYADGQSTSVSVIGTPAQPCPQIAVAEQNDPAVSYARLVDVITSEAIDPTDAPLVQSIMTGDGIATRQSVADVTVIEQLLTQSLDHRPLSLDSTPGMVVVCLDPTHSVLSSTVQSVFEQVCTEHDQSFTAVYEPAAVDEQIDMLTTEGVPVDETIWRDIFEYSQGILAPSFEGSEKGAGFDLNELTQ